MNRILVIEDETPIRELVRLNLEMSGYTVLEAQDGEEGKRLAQEEKVDLVILDLMLPKMDGHTVLSHLHRKQIPTIVLTARDQLQDRVKGLEMGADDYVTKPFEAVELLARVKSVLRRTEALSESVLLDDLEIVLSQRKVKKQGQEVDLTYKEFDLLRLLLENKGNVMSRELLLELVWGYEFEGTTRTVDMHVQRLRNKLQTDRIKTIYKVGYRWEE